MTVRFPITAEIGGDLVGMALAELRLCKVERRETVVLFTDTRTNPNYVSAFLAAGKELAGSIFEVKIPFLPQGDGKTIDLAPVIRVLKKRRLRRRSIHRQHALYLRRGIDRSLGRRHEGVAGQSGGGSVAPLLSHRRSAPANGQRRAMARTSDRHPPHFQSRREFDHAQKRPQGIDPAGHQRRERAVGIVGRRAFSIARRKRRRLTARWFSMSATCWSCSAATSASRCASRWQTA